jgi:hypothetical protein
VPVATSAVGATAATWTVGRVPAPKSVPCRPFAHPTASVPVCPTSPDGLATSAAPAITNIPNVSASRKKSHWCDSQQFGV